MEWVYVLPQTVVATPLSQSLMTLIYRAVQKVRALTQLHVAVFLKNWPYAHVTR